MKAYYIKLNTLWPGQLRYSSLNVKNKISSAIKSKNVCKHKNKLVPQFNNFTSIIPLTKALPVCKTSFGLVLIDGHHDVLASIYLKATTVPIYIKHDLSHLDQKNFWNEAEKNNIVYLLNPQGIRIIPPRYFENLEDDPYRYFAALGAMRYQQGKLVYKPKNPLWIKRDRSLAFIEFKIADVLYAYGKEYNFSYTNDIANNIPKDLIDKARSILTNHPIANLELFNSR